MHGHSIALLICLVFLTTRPTKKIVIIFSYRKLLFDYKPIVFYFSYGIASTSIVSGVDCGTVTNYLVLFQCSVNFTSDACMPSNAVTVSCCKRSRHL